MNIDAERTHAPSGCRGCGEPLSPASELRAHNARYAIDLIQPGAGATGLVLRQTKHTYLECRCACGHWTQVGPGRAEPEAEWTVALTEWHPAGPTLVAFICFLTRRMRLSRARVREFLLDRLGLAHLIGKAYGLEESLDGEAQRFGVHLPAVLETVIAAVYEVRSGAPPPAGGWRAHHAATLEALLDACERHAASRQ